MSYHAGEPTGSPAVLPERTGSMETTVEWGVRRPAGVMTVSPAVAYEAYMSPEELARKYAETGMGEAVSRTRIVVNTEWVEGESPAWIAGSLAVLAEVLAERHRQVATYGLNDECEDGTGPDKRWLSHTDCNLDLRTGKEIETAFRQEYVKHERAHGLPTWMHLIREEVAEAFAEDQPEKIIPEALQAAALLVSWVEAIHRRG